MKTRVPFSDGSNWEIRPAADGWFEVWCCNLGRDPFLYLRFGRLADASKFAKWKRSEDNRYA